MSSKTSDLPFIYFEARPKAGNREIVHKTITEISVLFAELYNMKANCKLHSEFHPNNGQWTVFMTFEKEKDRALMDQNPRFQEMMTDLRVYCKRAHKIKRRLYSLLHPGKRLAMIFSSPVRLSHK